MQTYISLLRGINVGGRRKIKMAELRQHCQNIGFLNTKTYIQSGNLIFQVKDSASANDVAQQLKEKIKIEYGFEIPTLSIKAEDWLKIQKQNPYCADSSIDIKRLHLTLLHETAQQEKIDQLKSIDIQADQYTIQDKSIYICAATERYSQCKLQNHFFEKKLAVATTTRNWKTVNKLAELLSTY